MTFEELKEADSTTGQANHRVSRGIHNKVQLSILFYILFLGMKNPNKMFSDEN